MDNHFFPELTDDNVWTQGLHVDPLNRKATARYIDVTLGEFGRHFPEYLGSTLKYVMLDSEGSFGGPIIWTPGFFKVFQAQKGYDFRQYLPLLINDGGAITAKVRNDYYDVVKANCL